MADELLLVARQPHEQVPIDREKALKVGRVQESDTKLLSSKEFSAQTFSPSSKSVQIDGLRNSAKCRTVRPRSRPREDVVPFLISSKTVCASGSGINDARWVSYHARSYGQRVNRSFSNRNTGRQTSSPLRLTCSSLNTYFATSAQPELVRALADRESTQTTHFIRLL